MRWKIKTVLIVSILLMLCGCQKIYSRAFGGMLALAADSGEESPMPIEIKGYTISYSEPDGENGYSKSAPKIEMTHQDNGINTKYRYTLPSGQIQEGMLCEASTSIRLEEDAGDGTYKLEVWMEQDPKPEIPAPERADAEESGQKSPIPDYSEELKKWEKTFAWEVDSIPPEIEIISPQAESWYNQAVQVRAKAKDSGSGLAVLSGTDNEMQAEGREGELSFVTQKISVGNQPVRIRIWAADRAGNSTNIEISVYIDFTPPILEITGAENYMISGKNVELIFAVHDENNCGKPEVLIERETPNGEKSETARTEWHSEGDKMVLSEKLEQDGVYRFSFSAADQAGNYAERKQQIIIDKTNPIIRCIELFQDMWMKEFCWNYDAAEIVEDFTTYSYHMEMDGRLYLPGEKIVREGRHVLKLSARDAAGNESSLSAQFMIDRTPPKLLWEEQQTKRGISDGENFEKEASIQIRTENADDKITEIVINGKREMLSQASNIFRSTLGVEMPYEMSVSAVDKAGNKTTDIRAIQVVKEKTMFEKMTEPVKRALLKKGGTVDSEQAYSEEENEEQNSIFAVIIVAVLLLAGTGVVLGYRIWGKK